VTGRTFSHAPEFLLVVIFVTFVALQILQARLSSYMRDARSIASEHMGSAVGVLAQRIVVRLESTRERYTDWGKCLVSLAVAVQAASVAGRALTS